ncbi:MAG: hypothetical protein CL927_20460 [Deltaproteobacteria bacterium]|nr:hypothetical protein [Deltaproteobacteria bacterium]HCH64714.1 hypothetical protein [Deltaproteobacteria bacterium]
MKYSDQEVKLLAHALCAAYVLVAWSDGHASAPEGSVFETARARLVSDLRLVENRMEEAAMAGLLDMYFSEDTIEAYRTLSESDLLRRIDRARMMVASKGSRAVAERYASKMNAIARELAEASRSLVFVGPKVSGSERTMLDRIAEVLAGP